MPQVNPSHPRSASSRRGGRRSTWARAGSACISLGVLAQLIGGCGSGPISEPTLDELRQALSPAERKTRAAQIRAAAEARGLHNGLLLAGIADIETGMSHCHSELTWACEGPNSADCGGGPVVAGAGDGPCYLQQGGLGMFQFDAGTFDQTLAREGNRILSIAGNTEAAVDFVIAMVKRSVYLQADTDQEAMDWMNRVRPWNELWHPWVQTVTHYYNGCTPSGCSVYNERYANYSRGGTGLLAEMGVDFWYGREPACQRIGADPTILDETGWCFAAGGNPIYWRNETSGFDGHLLWTETTADLEAANFARWYFYFDQPGRYEIEVYTAASFAQSEQARYYIGSDGQFSNVIVDQTSVDGWQSLGEFDFSAVGTLEVGDNTGEPLDGSQHLVADAVRVSLRDEIGGGGSGGSGGSAGGGGSGPEAGAGGLAGVGGEGGMAGSCDGATCAGAGGDGAGGQPGSPATRTVTDPEGCGCRMIGTASSSSFPQGSYFGAFALGLFGLLKRRRR